MDCGGGDWWTREDQYFWTREDSCDGIAHDDDIVAVDDDISPTVPF